MFLQEHGTAALLLSVIFLSLGFMLGKVTGKGHHGYNRGSCIELSCSQKSPCSHVEHPSDQDFTFKTDNHMIIVESMMKEGFEGDTILTIPGGEIYISIDGDDVDVRIEIEEEEDDEHIDH